jgi:hypothetical protein
MNCASTVQNQAASELGQNGGSLTEESPGDEDAAVAAAVLLFSAIETEYRRLW